MRKLFLRIIMISMVLIMVFPQSLLFANDNISDLKNLTTEEIKNLRTKSAFEQVVTEFFLSVGDYAQDYLSQTFRENITIDRLVYNKTVMLNANFFDSATNPAVSRASNVVKTVINQWFSYFQKLALVVIMIFVVVAGIKILLGSASGKVKAKEIFSKIFMAVALVFFFPYVMRYAFEINEAIVNFIHDKIHGVDTPAGAVISQVSDFLPEELEFRSPLYVSANKLKIGAGSTESTQLYLSKLDTYINNADMMRIMRAFAGVTLRFMYVIIWYILLVQTYIMTIIYIKRYIVIAFLIAVYPLVIIGYLSDGMFGSKQTAFNKWCNKFFTNVFLQTIHAICYGVIVEIVIKQIPGSLREGNVNWILMIVAISFLFSAEKIISKLWNAAIDTSERSGIKSFLGAPKRLWGQMKG